MVDMRIKKCDYLRKIQKYKEHLKPSYLVKNIQIFHSRTEVTWVIQRKVGPV